MYGFLEKMCGIFSSAYNTGSHSNIRKILSIVAHGYEQLYAALMEVEASRDIDNAVGVTLDKAGKNVGVFRNGMTDGLYRVYIKNKIQSSVSGADIDTVIVCVASLFGLSAYDVQLIETFPASVSVSIPEEAVLSLGGSYSERAEIARQFVRKIVASGIGVDLRLISTPKTSAKVVSGGAMVEETQITA